MEDTTQLRAAVVALLHEIDYPQDVEQPGTVITHAVLSAVEAWPPTLAMMERQAAQIEKMRKALAPFAEFAEGLEFYIEESWPDEPTVPGVGKADEVYGARTLPFSACRAAKVALESSDD